MLGLFLTHYENSPLGPDQTSSLGFNLKGNLRLIVSALQIPLAIATMFQKQLNNDRVGGTTPLCSFLTNLTAGYFCTETVIICKNFKEHGIEPLLHGAVCVVFFLMAAYKRKMQWFVGRVLFFECSTPLVHMRWFLASMGMADSTLYKVNGLSMMAAFLGCRVLWGTSALPLSLS